MKIKTQRGHTSWRDCQTPHPTYAVWDLLHSSFLLVAEKKGRDKTFHNLGSRWHSRHLESHRGSTGPQQFAGVAFSECAVLKSFKNTPLCTALFGLSRPSLIQCSSGHWPLLGLCSAFCSSVGLWGEFLPL